MNEKKDILERLSSLLIERKNYAEDNPYTNQLYSAGNDKILKKIEEEAAELIEAGSEERVIKKLHKLVEVRKTQYQTSKL